MPTYLDFEAPLAELEGKIAELRALATGDKTVSISDEVKGLEKKAAKQLTDLYANLEPWQKAQVARHPERPHAVDYIGQLITEFTPHGGRPQVRRGFRGGRRPRPLPGPARHGARPGKGQRHRLAPQAQFRHGAGPKATARPCG